MYVALSIHIHNYDISTDESSRIIWPTSTSLFSKRNCNNISNFFRRTHHKRATLIRGNTPCCVKSSAIFRDTAHPIIGLPFLAQLFLLLAFLQLFLSLALLQLFVNYRVLDFLRLGPFLFRSIFFRIAIRGWAIGWRRWLKLHHSIPNSFEQQLGLPLSFSCHFPFVERPGSSVPFFTWEVVEHSFCSVLFFS